MQTTRAVLLTLAALFLAAVATTGAQEAATFEVRAVADRPGPYTRPYLGVTAGNDGKAESTLLVDPPLLDSSAVRFVSLDYDPEDRPVIMINLTEAGKKRFEQLTKDMVGKQLGLLIAGQLYALPRILETVHGGKIAISGSFSARQAANLVERLNASLPGKVSER